MPSMPAETLEGIVDPGLTESDVLIRQRQTGFNELPSTQSRNLLVIAGDSFKDPICLLLGH
jgi:magnesium-transporting ATPase (P-type)